MRAGVQTQSRFLTRANLTPDTGSRLVPAILKSWIFETLVTPSFPFVLIGGVWKYPKGCQVLAGANWKQLASIAIKASGAWNAI